MAHQELVAPRIPRRGKKSEEVKRFNSKMATKRKNKDPNPVTQLEKTQARFILQSGQDLDA
uniref:Uncharacterized protein n=1 Tax=Oryza punctata TaxID=4537 RepID=A0A0E0LP10_ORYPU